MINHFRTLLGNIPMLNDEHGASPRRGLPL